MAIMKGHEAIVTTLLSSGVDVNAPARVDGRGYTPLLMAAQEGNETMGAYSRRGRYGESGYRREEADVHSRHAEPQGCGNGAGECRGEGSTGN